MAIKNFWSLQVGEAVAADTLKSELGKDYEVFIPLNNELTGYDLLLVNNKNRKILKIQVKESRQYKEGQGWFKIDKDKVNGLVADFYIFIIYRIVNKNGNEKFEHPMLIVPSKVLREKSKGKKISKGKNNREEYNYNFKIFNNSASEDRDNKVDYSEYINNFKILK